MSGKLIIALLLLTGFSAFASFVDDGRWTDVPYISEENFQLAIARKYFPEIREYLPKGLSRKDAWTSDIRKVAQKNGLTAEQVAPLLEFVLKYRKPVKAPHPELLEFELYARGKYELFCREHKQMPQSWQKLLALPLEKRLYTTIPVLRAYVRYRDFHGGNPADFLQQMLRWKKQGCKDTQGCILDLLNDVGRNPHDYAEWQLAYKMIFRKQFVNHSSLKNKSMSPAALKDLKDAQDQFYTIEADIRHLIYLESVENLRKLCQSDPAMRDLIVLTGLTNTMTTNARKVAWEFYKESVINYPVAATRLPWKEGVKLLENQPEHRALRDTLIIQNTTGQEKIDAIDKYIADYLSKSDCKSEFYGLYDRQYLNALAGAELFYAGKPHEAAERWLKGCHAADIAAVAEQVMTVDELKKFCDKHFPTPVLLEEGVDFRNYQEQDYNLLKKPEELNFLLRNLLARRLMRAGRFEEARAYFTGVHTRKRSEKFFALQKILNSPSVSKSEKTIAMLNMAALVRFDGDRLFGTYLEPDNLICRNRYAYTWGKKQKSVKLNKEKLPRYSYRYRAAKLYEKAADMTSDRKIKALALWTGGSMLKNLSPRTADYYFKRLYAVAPEMTEKNWFLPRKKSSFEQQAFYQRRLFVNGKLEDYVPQEPIVIPVKLSVDKNDTMKLRKFGLTMLPGPQGYRSDWKFARGEYALKIAGDKGDAIADVTNSLLSCELENYETALWYLRRAGKKAPESGLVKFETGRVYILLGHWTEGVKLVKQVADTEKDKMVRGNAALFLAQVYYQVLKDPQKGKYYLDLVRSTGLPQALNLKIVTEKK
ncbi:MAG: hypothetical protein E7044_13795 [Lentisphaerae bacterium]|nr:hypothetical protein [Lentisphaerota bacterium]